MKPFWTFLAGLFAAALITGWIVGTWYRGNPTWAPFTQVPDVQLTNPLYRVTGTTVRLGADSLLGAPVPYSQVVYAASQDEDKPGAVILVPADDERMAITTTRLQHFPVNAPLLFATDEGLPDVTRRELERLDPEGVGMDNNVQVYVAGDLPDAVNAEVEAMGFRTRRLYAESAVELSRVIDEYVAVLESNHKDPVMIGAFEAPAYALPAANWNAHAGDGFAWVSTRGVPDETRAMLERRAPNYPYIYVFAPPEVIGQDVLDDLSRYGHVQRIPGATPQEMAVRWAGYKDSGRLVGWWFGQRSRSIGWGIAEAGHNVIVANPTDWREVVPTGVMSHMGKHAPLILTNPDGSLPDVARAYLEVLRPTRVHPSTQVYNFAWIAGAGIPAETQRVVTELLSVQDATPLTPQTIGSN